MAKLSKDTDQLFDEYNRSAFVDLLDFSAQQKQYLKNLISEVKEAIPLFPTFGWDHPNAIQSALANHDAGLFSSSELLFHAMKRDARIYSALRTRVKVMRNYVKKLLISKSAPVSMQMRTRELEKSFDKILSPDLWEEALERVIMFGFAIARVVVKYDDNLHQYIPTFKIWSHSYIYYNHHERIYYVTTKEHGYVPVTGPGWVFFTSGGERPWLNGAMRALGLAFFVTNQSLNGWNSFNAVESKAYKYIKVPALKVESDETQTLYDKIHILKGGDTIISTSDTDVSLLSSQGRSSAYNTYKDLIKWADDTKSIVLLGNNLMQDIQGGSYAATKEVTQTIASDIIESDTQIVERAINQYLMPIWTDLNFTPSIYGYSTLQQYCPVLDLDNIQIHNEENLAKAHKNYADAFAKFVESVGSAVNDIDIDFKEAARRAGIPLKEDKLIKDDIL